jgi:hypothetical protein
MIEALLIGAVIAVGVGLIFVANRLQGAEAKVRRITEAANAVFVSRIDLPLSDGELYQKSKVKSEYLNILQDELDRE